MNKLKTWLSSCPTIMQLAILLTVSVITFGLLGPSMISSNSTIAVWIGIAICVSVAYVVWELSGDLRNKLK